MVEGPCIPDSVCQGGKCAAPPGVGEACTPTPGLGCNWMMGIYCDDTAKKCMELTIAKLGEKCTLMSLPFVFCAAGTHCDGGTCVVDVADGASCGTPSGLDCSWPALCIKGKCATLSAAACD